MVTEPPFLGLFCYTILHLSWDLGNGTHLSVSMLPIKNSFIESKDNDRNQLLVNLLFDFKFGLLIMYNFQKKGYPPSHHKKKTKQDKRRKKRHASLSLKANSIK